MASMTIFRIYMIFMRAFTIQEFHFQYKPTSLHIIYSSYVHIINVFAFGML